MDSHELHHQHQKGLCPSSPVLNRFGN